MTARRLIRRPDNAARGSNPPRQCAASRPRLGPFPRWLVISGAALDGSHSRSRRVCAGRPGPRGAGGLEGRKLPRHNLWPRPPAGGAAPAGFPPQPPCAWRAGPRPRCRQSLFPPCPPRTMGPLPPAGLPARPWPPGVPPPSSQRLRAGRQHAAKRQRSPRSPLRPFRRPGLQLDLAAPIGIHTPVASPSPTDPPKSLATSTHRLVCLAPGRGRGPSPQLARPRSPHSTAWGSPQHWAGSDRDGPHSTRPHGEAQAAAGSHGDHAGWPDLPVRAWLGRAREGP